MIAIYTISIPQKQKKKKPTQWDLLQPDVLWQIRKSEETSSPDDDDVEDDECECLLACLCAAIPQQKERKTR